jgi:hypothetical protein
LPDWMIGGFVHRPTGVGVGVVLGVSVGMK